jgi:hypothetical protein
MHESLAGQSLDPVLDDALQQVIKHDFPVSRQVTRHPPHNASSTTTGIPVPRLRRLAPSAAAR